jgi:hypothetical protein
VVDCLRCAVPLSPTGQADPLRFHQCPRCGRAFTERADGTLVERWLGPLSVALYGVIFDPRPQEPERVRAVADTLGHLDTGHIAAEIRLELAHPTQPVAEIVGPMRAGEDDLREFLRLLADELELRAAS